MREGEEEGKGTVLIVDDDAGSVRKLRELLEHRGFSILVARSKQEALEALSTCRSDLMTLDFEKPHLEGPQILTTVRADERNRHLPVIVFTTGAIAKERAQGLRWGADDFIPKPVDPEEFAARIEVWLRISRLRQEAVAKNRALSALYAIATSLSRSLNLKEVMEQALQQILELMELDAGVVRLPNHGGQEFTVSAGKGVFVAELEAIGSLRPSEEFSRAMAKGERPILIGDIADAQGVFAGVKALPGVRSAAGMPLVSKHRVVGTLSMFGKHPRAFTQEEERLLAGLGHQLGVAIENARLFEETTEALARSNLLYELSNQLHSIQNFEETLQLAAQQILEAFQADGTVISLHGAAPGAVTRVGVFMSGQQSFERSLVFDPIAQAVMDAGKPILIPRAGAALDDFPASLLEEGVKALLAVPVQGMSGRHGALALSYRRPREFRPLEVETLVIYANHLGIALENATSFRQLQKHAAHLSELYKATLLVSGSLDLTETLALIVRTAAQASGAASSDVLLLGRDGQLSFAAMYDPNGHFDQPIAVRSNGISRAVLRTGQIWMIPDFEREPSGRVNPDLIRAGKRAAICLPLRMKGRDSGVMWVHYDHPRTFAEEDVHLLSAFANQAAIAIENARLFQEINRLAITDELTGLYNYRHFYHQLEQEFKRAQRYDRPLSLIMLDIDFFKRYNDRNGHLAGDQALRLIAGRLRGNTRGVDILARYAGDEFSIILPETDLGQGWVQAERIRSAIQRDSQGAQGPTGGENLTMSLGVACLGPEMRHAEDLVRAADQALYRVKAAGGNQTSLA